MILKTLSLLSILILFSSLNTASAEDRIYSMRLAHADNPTFCIMEPSSDLTEIYHEYLLKTTFDAVMEWQTEMNQFTEGDWDIPVFIYEYEEHFDKDISWFPLCNIFIEYEMKNMSDVVSSSALGYASYDFSKSWHKWSYIKIYATAEQETTRFSLCIGCEPKTSEIIQEKNHKLLDRDTVRFIILHEIGHAIGLGHYIIGLDSKSTDTIMLPALKPFAVENKDVKIGLIDKLALVEIYGKDGFGGLEGSSHIEFFSVNDLLKDTDV